MPRSRGSAPNLLNPIIRFIIAIVLPPKWLPDAVKRILNPRHDSCTTMKSYFPALIIGAFGVLDCASLLS